MSYYLLFSILLQNSTRFKLSDTIYLLFFLALRPRVMNPILQNSFALVNC